MINNQKINEKDKNLINEFFYNVFSFDTLYKSEEIIWKITPQCNSYLEKMINISDEISIKDGRFEKIFLDFRSAIDMQEHGEYDIDQYKDFILEYSDM